MLVAVLAVGAAVAAFGGDAEKEQGLIPESFDSHKIAQFAAFTAIVTVVAPIVEELMFRGVGYGLLERFGRTTAVILVGLAFALIHGLVAGFPVIATFGIGLAYLRSRTDSIYPCILLHASFNAAGLAYWHRGLTLAFSSNAAPTPGPGIPDLGRAGARNARRHGQRESHARPGTPRRHAHRGRRRPLLPLGPR